MPSLASTPQAQQDFRELHERWRSLSPSKQKELEPELRAFLQEHPQDGRAALVRVYLALTLLEQKRNEEASQVLGPLRQAPAGRTRDLAKLANALLLLGEGQPARSRRELEPLRGKLIDAEERLLYGELLVRSALAEGHLPEAVLDMRWWLTEVDSSDVPEVKSKVLGIITRFDSQELEQARAWLGREQAQRTPETAAIDGWLEQQVTAELARSAIRDKNADLARHLMHAARGQLPDDKVRQELDQIARGGELARRVVGRTLGLVLSLRDPKARTRSSRLSAGVTEELGLPAPSSDPERVRLLVKDDQQGMRSALADLAGEGASILLAGLDDEGAAQAAEFAEQAAIPVLIPFQSTGAVRDYKYAFSLGVAQSTVRQLLLDALERQGASHWVEVGDSAGAQVVSCDRPRERADQPRFPVQQWKRQRVDGVLLLADERCSRELALELGQAGLTPTLALGLEAVGLAFTPGFANPMLRVQTGGFASSPSAAAPGVSGFWYEALGRDAASLARAALASSPTETIDDARVVRELHAQARDRLLSASVKLSTTHASGFAGGHELPRKFAVFASDGVKRR